MTPGEFKRFAKTMRDFGISHFKMGDVEINMGQDILKETIADKVPTSEVAGSNPALAATPEEDNIIKHKVEQLESLMKLSDMELVDELFPDETQEHENDEIA